MNTSPTPQSTFELDLSYLDLMADGDDSMKQTMLDMLVEEIPIELDKLREAFLSRDAEQLRQVAHKMKSTLAFVGNEALTVANATLEKIGQEGHDLSRAAQHLQVLEQGFVQVVPELQRLSAELA